jgi:shikimate dehydrogenase
VVTRPYAEVIGDPIAQSKSPTIHKFWLENLKIDADYRACHVRPEELADYFAQRREDASWQGCNVTIPHKERVAELLDHVRPEAARVGAANTIFQDPDTGLTGTNTDVDGVREALHGLDLTSRPVLVIGAGGAARAAFAYLDELGCAEVRVMARQPSKAERALESFALNTRVFGFDREGRPFADAAAVINATQLGMTGQAEMPRFVFDGLAQTAGDCRVFDMVYAPLETALLNHAAQLGRSTSHGLTMLIGQARKAFARFYGEDPPRDLDHALLGLLTQ